MTWNIVKDITNRRTAYEEVLTLKIDGKLTENCQVISNTLNDYFVSSAIRVNGGKLNICYLNINHPMAYLYQTFNKHFPSIKFKHTSTREIKKIISSLKPSNSYGYGEISTNILKTCAQFIISSLTYICNQSLSTGIFPSWLKYSAVKPLFKKGNKNDMSNYRPISLLKSFSKIFKKLIYARIYQHLIDNNVLVDEQYGFRVNSSTVKATHKLLNTIVTALNNRNIVGGIFCDLHKPFDCVNHKILLAKMEFYGITGKFLNLIKSYLEDRYQKVSICSNTPIISLQTGKELLIGCLKDPFLAHYCSSFMLMTYPKY
jgi:Notch-like protein